MYNSLDEIGTCCSVKTWNMKYYKPYNTEQVSSMPKKPWDQQQMCPLQSSFLTLFHSLFGENTQS